MPTLQKKKPQTRLDSRQDVEAKEVSAQEVLEKHQTVTLSNRDFDAFLEAIAAEEEPNEALEWAAERYQQRLGWRKPLC